ncbi:ribonuclease H-like domain-containing protein [Tanacetum coccineum]
MSVTWSASHRLKTNPPGSKYNLGKILKTKFLSKYFPPARTTKKMEEINNFQQELDENLYQAWERFKELLMKCPQHYLTEMQEVVLFYNRLDVPTRQILDSRGVIPSKTAADTKVAIQEMAEYSKKWHNGTLRTRSTETSDGLAAIQAQLNNLGREIKKVNEKVYAAQVGCEQCKGGGYRATASGFYQRNNANPSYHERRQSMEETLSKFKSESAKRHEENSNLVKEIRASTDATIRNQGASIKTLEIQIGQMSKIWTVKYPKGNAEKHAIVVIGKFVFPVGFINLDIPKDIKVPLILGRPFLSTARAKIDVFKRKITLRVGEEKIIFKSVKPASEVVEEFRARIDARMVSKVFGYPSNCDHDKKIHIDCAYSLKFSCMIDFAVLEDMDAYHDEGMGDVIFGELFLREVRIKAKRFEGMITIYNM